LVELVEQKKITLNKINAPATRDKDASRVHRSPAEHLNPIVDSETLTALHNNPFSRGKTP